MKLFKLAALASTVALASYFSLYTILSTYSQFNSERITTQQQLEELLAEERKLLDNGREDVAVQARLFDETVGVAWRSPQDGVYRIKIGGFMAKRSILRHELYHVFDGHCDDFIGASKTFIRLKSFFVHEPQATAYQVFGIKL